MRNLGLVGMGGYCPSYEGTSFHRPIRSVDRVRQTRHDEREMSTATSHCYIITDERVLGGEPIIKGTRTPVRAIVEQWRLGVAPEVIPNRLPHLSLAQVFDALSYYSDHTEEINRAIERNRVGEDRIDPLVKDL